MSKLYNLSDKKESTKSSHKLTAECFTNCAKWKLNSTMKINKTSVGSIFQGRAFFLKKFKNSIINSFKLIDSISEITKSTIKTIEEKACCTENNQSDYNVDFTSFKFPMNNNDFIEANPGFYEELNNFLFIEFEFNKTTNEKDWVKYLKEINNDFVDKDIHLVLNGTIHGIPIFKQDLNFTIEAKKIIKSVQFRLEEYKNEFIQKQRTIQRSNPKFEIKNTKTNFFTKLITHPNVAIEFNKPNFDNVEYYPTNFNSIVNSKIKIEKIYFELRLKSRLGKKNNFNNELQGKLLSDPANLMYSFSNFTDLTKTISSDFETEDNLSSSKGKNNSTKSVSSDNGSLKNEYKNRKGTLSTSTGDISIYDGNICNENKGEHNLQSHKSYSYYNPQYKNKYNQSQIEREAYYHNEYDYNSKYYESYYMKSYNPAIITGQNYNPSIFYSEKYNYGYYNADNTGNYSSKDCYYTKNNYEGGSYNKYISSSNNYCHSNGDGYSNNYPKIYTAEKLKKNVPKDKYYNSLQIILTHYEGMCNFMVFAKACTPYVPKDEVESIYNMKIIDFLKNFEKISAFGLDINYMNESNIQYIYIFYQFKIEDIANVNYSPTLSSMEILISDIYTCNFIREELLKLRLEKSEENKFYEYLFQDKKEILGNDYSYGKISFEYNVNDNLKIICLSTDVKIEFYETKPPHSRYILSEQFENIFSKLKFFNSIDLSKIEKCSWFSVLWSPFKSNQQLFSNTSFLTYYQFDIGEYSYCMTSHQGYYEVPIVGILPIKLDENIWLRKFRKSKISD